tara:strand:- start:104 stop:241 length:138 start_codon:yes stop_codon:yes gene_type:complete
MLATGWTWDELQATPYDVVQRTRIYLQVKHVKEHGGTLDFPEGAA